MKRFPPLFAVAVVGVAILGLSRRAKTAEPEYQWNLPKGFPAPYVPPDNPMTTAKVELGRSLFYDARMSVNGRESCATCHVQSLAFTDGRAVGIGVTGEHHSRGSMSLVNIAYAGALTWSNPPLKSLEEQALTPMFGQHPVELGLREGDGFVPMLRGSATYKALFAAAFPADADAISIQNVTRALASFERSIISARSPYDRYHYGGEDRAVSEAAKHGEKLFFNQHLACFRCHSGFNFSDSSITAQNPARQIEFHNTGLYNDPGPYSYPAPNLGIYEYTKALEDVGKFKTPTLRNIAVTAPYMHDGSIDTLEGVIDHYAAGGRGRGNPNKDPLIAGFEISPQEKQDLIAFLETLTDEAVLSDPWFGPPGPPSRSGSMKSATARR